MIIITGKVIKGQRYGRVLGFPTANLDRRQFVRQRLKIKLGVYAGRVEIGKREQGTGKIWQAAIVIGPMDKHHLPKIEAHLLNFKGSLYGQKMTISLGRYIRPFQKFVRETELQKQIKIDIGKIKRST